MKRLIAVTLVALSFGVGGKAAAFDAAHDPRSTKPTLGQRRFHVPNKPRLGVPRIVVLP